ncbi:TPA: pentapeptide repeat-containing protein [Vibrio vulnificus]|nr:pentapeptide repeat-containing protein [Vibrio vulnificus]HAS8515941.1 pentapeptide repeat-containing protein [Vibrio vulnificus]
MKNMINNEQYFDVSFEKLSVPDEQYREIEFEKCQFSDCDFSSVRFQKCKFTNCTFERCNLSLVDLTGSKLFELEFYDCKLVGVDWTKATWPVYHSDFELSFKRCILNDSSFFGLTLNELVLDECKLHDVDFRDGNFADSTMTYSDFHHSLFMRTNLQGVDFSESTAYSIDVLGNNVKKAKFSRYEALSLLESLGIELID